MEKNLQKHNLSILHLLRVKISHIFVCLFNLVLLFEFDEKMRELSEKTGKNPKVNKKNPFEE